MPDRLHFRFDLNLQMSVQICIGIWLSWTFSWAHIRPSCSHSRTKDLAAARHSIFDTMANNLARDSPLLEASSVEDLLKDPSSQPESSSGESFSNSPERSAEYMKSLTWAIRSMRPHLNVQSSDNGFRFSNQVRDLRHHLNVQLSLNPTLLSGYSIDLDKRCLPERSAELEFGEMRWGEGLFFNSF